MVMNWDVRILRIMQKSRGQWRVEEWLWYWLATGVLVVLFMWVIFFHKHEEESLAKLPNYPANVRYERIDVSVEKHTKDDEN